MARRPLIAIVDDDAGVRLSLDGLVRSFGYDVSTFPSAEAFLQSRDAERSSLVISDVTMPGGMSGIALARVLADGSKLPVVLISAFMDEKVSEEARSVGVRHVLRKPFELDVFIGAIEEALAA